MTLLIIAEKPSVASDIAAALGGFSRRGNHFERPDAVVTAARGHLVAIGIAQSEDPGFVLDRLPALPNPFVLAPTSDGKGPLATIRELAHRPDVDLVVNACDAGREGELIFRLIMEYLRIRLPVQRMWLRTMTTAGIRQAFASRRPDEAMRALADAARSRAEADWLVGINATRALTKANLVSAGELVAAGRVQTPTLAIVVDRENARLAFVSRPFWEVIATLEVASGQWEAKWFDSKQKTSGDEDQRPDRLFESEAARRIVERCRGVPPSEVVEESKPVKRAPPKLFDLTSLQREANNKLGLSAARTLSIAQALYETHKVLTYPRTDSQHLPADYAPKVADVMRRLPDPFAGLASMALQAGWVAGSHPIFDDAKISDHFAIIPTGKPPEGLDADAAAVYQMVVRRFLAAFFPPAEYRETRRLVIIASEHFRAMGRVLVTPGWLKVYDGDMRVLLGSEAGDRLPAMARGETVRNVDVVTREGRTTPPPRFTEATLLAAMEAAGRLLEDDSLAQAMKDRGLGTPATRANTIEELLSDRKGYLKRSKKDLVPTPKAMQLIATLRRIGLEMLVSPELTGGWEARLAAMERGGDRRAEFMRDVVASVQSLVDKVRGAAQEAPAGGAAAAPGGKVLGVCVCKRGDLVEAPKSWTCRACGLTIWKEIAGRKLRQAELNALRSKGATGVVEGFRSRAGKTFSASMKVVGAKVELVFPERQQ